MVYNFPMRSQRAGAIFILLINVIFLVSSCRGLVKENQTDLVLPTTFSLETTTLTPVPTKASLENTTATVVPSPSPEKTSVPETWIFPDAEVVYSPSSADFNIADYLRSTSGFLAEYEQFLMITGWSRSADIVEMVALENSINPKLLLALIEYQSGFVFMPPANAETLLPAMGNTDHYRQDLYGQLDWAVHRLSEGFYGWLNGTIQEIPFQDGQVFIPPAEINPGTFALQYFFAQFHSGEQWEDDLDPVRGFPALYLQMFGDPWINAAALSPLIPTDLVQPDLGLPFEIGVTWALTGGPHQAFEGNGPLAALDFVPPMAKAGCFSTGEWVAAVADGLVVRSEFGQVIQDLDGDGLEQTGWAILYLHVGEEDRVPVGTYLKKGDYLGHPSCEGGRAFGTHLHLARKFNGVWIAADGVIPFVMDGWRAFEGEVPYRGGLKRGREIVTADQFGALCSLIERDCTAALSTIAEKKR